MGLKRIDMALAPEREVSASDVAYFKEVLKKLAKHMPIQYIFGEHFFCGHRFLVNKHVLIPRPETEELVAWITADIRFREAKKQKNIKVIDIGTGSGCIAVSIARNFPNAEVWALDNSVKALEIARENAVLNKVTIRFVERDILELEKLPKRFDIIVSNPPYVRMSEKKQMAPNVLDNEPHEALFVTDENPLLFYEKTGRIAVENLTEKGTFYVEINQYLAPQTIQLLKETGFRNIMLKKDIFGNDRMLRSVK